MVNIRNVRVQNLVKNSVPGGVKDAIKNLVWRVACRHENVRPPILLFASRRAGGTWLAELISRQKGVLFVNEPTETGKHDRVALRNGIFPSGILEQKGIPISSVDLNWVISFFKQIVDGVISIRQPWNPFSANFHSTTDRVLIKTHVTKPHMQAISKSFHKSTNIWLVRYPIPQALSSRRTGSQVTSEFYLKIPQILAELTNSQTRTCNEILHDGTPDERMLLDRCLENLIPIRNHETIDNLICVSYEQLVLERLSMLEYLGAACDLNGPADDAGRDGPSISTSERSKARVITNALQGSATARQTLVGSWLDTVSNRTMDQC